MDPLLDLSATELWTNSTSVSTTSEGCPKIDYKKKKKKAYYFLPRLLLFRMTLCGGWESN